LLDPCAIAGFSFANSIAVYPFTHQYSAGEWQPAGPDLFGQSLLATRMTNNMVE